MHKVFITLLTILSFPGSINAFPFGRNLEFKNDIGTRILIKGDAVYSKYLMKDDLKDSIKDLISRSNKLYMKQMRYVKKNKARDMSSLKMYSKGGYLEKVEGSLESRAFYKRQVEISNEKMNIYSEKNEERIQSFNLDLKKLDNIGQSIKIQAVNLTFKPILIDLNNNQTIQSEVKLTCLNEDLPKELENIWLDYYPLEGGDSKRELAICKKYAKFK